MNYWSLQKPRPWPFRELESPGPMWSQEAYYEEDYVSPRYGKFDPARLELIFSHKYKRRKIADFYMAASPPSCTLSTYALVEPLIGAHVVTFPMAISEIPYITFRPNSFFDLLDLERTGHDTTQSGLPHNFWHITLKSLPPVPMPIFGFSSPITAQREIIVNDEFKKVCEENSLTGLCFEQAWPPCD